MGKQVICEVLGGLGNQLFCYAAGMAAAKELGLFLSLDISGLDNDGHGRVYSLDNFRILDPKVHFSRRNVIGRALRKARLSAMEVVGTQSQYEQLKKGQTGKTIYLGGYWHEQNYKIFHASRSDLQKKIAYNKSQMNGNYAALVAGCSAYHTVAVHIRRGDYVKIGCCMDSSYYGMAIQKIENELASSEKPVRLLIFSEDIETARSIIERADKCFEKVYITRDLGLTDVEEFLLMRNCDDHIISNSTFSWWAAYLHDGGTTIAPVIRGWIKNAWEEDYFPEDWITIETKLMNE